MNFKKLNEFNPKYLSYNLTGVFMLKYMICLTLLFSANTFAQDFDPNLLVGKWECKIQAKSVDFSYQTTEKYIVDYQKDGTYLSKTVLYGVLDNEKMLQKIKTFGYWRISQGVFSANYEKILDYSNNNPRLEKRYEFEQYFNNDKSFENFPIIELSKNKFVLNMNKDDFIATHECNRSSKSWQL